MKVQFILLAITACLVLLATVYVVTRKRKKSTAGKSEPLSVEKKSGLAQKLSQIFSHDVVSSEFLAELESTLVECDVGIECTSQLIEEIKTLSSPEEVKKHLAARMESILSVEHPAILSKPHVILVVGVNGVGKTTTLAKLAKKYLNDGKKVLMIAGDTYRAAAIEQIKVWGERLSVEVVSQLHGADSSAVIFDGIEKAKVKGIDIVIADTAGRLHNKQGLMDELKKVSRVAGKAMAGAPHEKLLVIDSTVGVNGLIQAREFNNAIGITGVAVTKNDGTAKGGIVLAVATELKLPIQYLGVGEGMDDLKLFDAHKFVASLI